jgi:hypothetical protein
MPRKPPKLRTAYATRPVCVSIMISLMSPSFSPSAFLTAPPDSLDAEMTRPTVG